MNREKGRLGEERACRYLQAHGLLFLGKNYQTRYGEIDLIMREQQTLVFVEVKYRSSTRWGTPFEAITWQKKQKLQLVAKHYLHHHRISQPCRFDVVGIIKDQIHWVKGVFS